MFLKTTFLTIPEKKNELCFTAQEKPSVALAGTTDVFPVHRIYCVGQNYANHAREMGANPEREAPFFFSKPADAVCPEGTRLPFPLATENLHHEIELVIAIGKKAHIFHQKMHWIICLVMR